MLVSHVWRLLGVLLLLCCACVLSAPLPCSPDLNGLPGAVVTGAYSSGGVLGDVNGDGKTDRYAVVSDVVYVIFSADDFDVNSFGPSEGVSISTGNVPVHVAGTSDYNGDGIADIIIGAPSRRVDGDVDNGGTVFLVLGRTNWGTDSIDIDQFANVVKYTGISVNKRVGSCVGDVGDVQGDGRPDFAFCTDTNRIFIVFGVGPGGTLDDSDTTSARPDMESYVTFSDVQSPLQFVAVGDVNGDGMDDLFVFSRFAQGPGVDNVAYVLFGRVTWNTATVPGTEENKFVFVSGSLPASVAAAGDMNGNGYADIALTSIDGRYIVVFGSAFWSSFTLYPFQSDDFHHTKIRGFVAGNDPIVTGVGDQNGDGYDDLLFASQVEGNVQLTIMFGAAFSGTGPHQSGPLLVIDGPAGDPQSFQVFGGATMFSGTYGPGLDFGLFVDVPDYFMRVVPGDVFSLCGRPQCYTSTGGGYGSCFSGDGVFEGCAICGWSSAEASSFDGCLACELGFELDILDPERSCLGACVPLGTAFFPVSESNCTYPYAMESLCIAQLSDGIQYTVPNPVFDCDTGASCNGVNNCPIYDWDRISSDSLESLRSPLQAAEKVADKSSADNNALLSGGTYTTLRTIPYQSRYSASLAIDWQVIPVPFPDEGDAYWLDPTTPQALYPRYDVQLSGRIGPTSQAQPRMPQLTITVPADPQQAITAGKYPGYFLLRSFTGFSAFTVLATLGCGSWVDVLPALYSEHNMFGDRASFEAHAPYLNFFVSTSFCSNGQDVGVKSAPAACAGVVSPNGPNLVAEITGVFLIPGPDRYDFGVFNAKAAFLEVNGKVVMDWNDCGTGTCRTNVVTYEHPAEDPDVARVRIILVSQSITEEPFVGFRVSDPVRNVAARNASEAGRAVQASPHDGYEPLQAYDPDNVFGTETVCTYVRSADINRGGGDLDDFR